MPEEQRSDQPTPPDAQGSVGGSGPRQWLDAFLAMPNDTTKKTLAVALVLCLVCSVVVSTAAVALKPLQERNRATDRQRNILEVAGLLQSGRSVQQIFDDRIEARVVDLSTGEYAGDIDPAKFDQRRAAKDPARSVNIPPDEDIAGIGRRAEHATVYVVKGEEGEVRSIILPVHGYGLWSTLYGFLALSSDGDTVQGLKFYDHAETPGLGGEVDNPRWRAQWEGKQVYGDQGRVQIEVVRGNVDPSREGAEHKVDGLAGATLTSNGVTNLLHYWLGEQGFGPFLARMSESRG